MDTLFMVVAFAVLIGVVVANVADSKRRETPSKKDYSPGQKLAIGVAAAVSTLGLFAVGFMIFFLMAMSRWADSK